MNPVPFGPLTLIVDSGAARSLSTLQKALSARGLEIRNVHLPTSSSGVTAAAAEALAAGERYLVAVGGDRTVHSVVNALFDPQSGSPVAPDLVLAELPTPGFACDLLDTFGLPHELGPATGHLMGDAYYELDLVKATVHGRGGGEVSRWFAIAAEAGLGAAVAGRRAGLPRFLGRGRQFLGFWLAYAGARTRAVRVDGGGRKTYDGPAYNIVIGNCQFFGDGLRVSPRSYPGDGVLDVLIMKGPRSDAYTTLPKMYRGEHVPSDHIEEMTGKTITVTSTGKPLPVHVDGEVIGRTPATFEVIPQAVRFKV